MATYSSGERRTYRGPYGASEGAMSSNGSIGVLGPDGKMNASSAAQSLKYAKPHELPSHPSVGVEHSTSSANKAATLAAGGHGPDGPRYKGTDTGFAAANTALKHQSSHPHYGVSDEDRKDALLAATMSVNRGKAKASPIGTPPLSSKAIQATRMKRINMPAEMFTEHPPVEIEKEVERYQAALRASALSMAKQLYKLEQNKTAEPAKGKQPNYIGLKETAQQLAAARLAKLDPDGLQAYREHYGYGISLGRSGIMLDDKQQASKIRGQSAQLNALLASVDEDKRKKDRDALMALAEKRVQERMKALDQQVFSETGQMLPSVGADWEAQARAKAQGTAEADAEQRQLTTLKVHIGGNKYIDMSEVEKVAAARLQPTLDEMTVTAQKRRERDEEIRIAEEERRKQQAEERAEAQKEKDERRMKEYQQKNELRLKMAEEKSERNKIKAVDDAERRRVKDQERMKEYQEKNERRIKENEEKAERKKVEDEQKTERRRIEGEQRVERQKIEAEQRATRAQEKAARDKLKAEDRAKWDRIKAEERADRERMQAEDRAERQAKREREHQERLERIQITTDQTEKERLIEEDHVITDRVEAADAAADEEAADDVSPGAEDSPIEVDEAVEASDAATQIKVVDTPVVAETSEDVVREELTEGGLTGSDAARDVASRVFGAPVDEVAEADQVTMSRGIETEDGIKMIDENVTLEDGETAIESAAAPESAGEIKLNPAVPPMGRRESRRKSFFSKIKQQFRGSRSDRASTTATTSTSAVGDSEALAGTEDSTVGTSIADGTTETSAATNGLEVDKADERAGSEGGLYSEPSDTTERPNEERAHEEGDNVSSMYATDDADYEEARARTSTSSDQFADARTDVESVATTIRENPLETSSASKFQEAL